MIKGGFQGLDISGVDLTAQSPTLPGGYAACQAAEGKTVLVLTAAGAVQCSVKKVSTNYVLAGITGDGKILSITIGSTDGISVSENVPGDESVDHLDASVDILNATSSAKFTVPADGYVKVEVESSVTLTKMFRFMTQYSTSPGVAPNAFTDLVFLNNGASGPVSELVFVRKGMKVWCSSSVDAGVTAEYYKLV